MKLTMAFRETQILNNKTFDLIFFFWCFTAFVRYFEVILQQSVKPNLNANDHVAWLDQSNVYTTHFEFEWWLKFYKFLQNDMMMKPLILSNEQINVT